jgi:dTDP-4-dehydrorhamnose 3,5-epimerase
MKITPTEIPDVLVIEPKMFGDVRGFFFESFNKQPFHRETGAPFAFRQDNHSGSASGALRGLYYQIRQPQGKLVRVVRGAVFDVVVDIPKDSATFGKWVGIELTEKNHLQVRVPPGLAHGFLVVDETADVPYETTDYYTPRCERNIAWNDPAIGIRWPSEKEPLLSPKDGAAPSMADGLRCDAA